MFFMGGLGLARTGNPTLAACDVIVLSCTFFKVLVHCSPEFSQTGCIDIQGLFLIPITALSLSLSPSFCIAPSFRKSLSFPSSSKINDPNRCSLMPVFSTPNHMLLHKTICYMNLAQSLPFVHTNINMHNISIATQIYCFQE